MKRTQCDSPDEKNKPESKKQEVSDGVDDDIPAPVPIPLTVETDSKILLVDAYNTFDPKKLSLSEKMVDCKKGGHMLYINYDDHQFYLHTPFLFCFQGVCTGQYGDRYLCAAYPKNIGIEHMHLYDELSYIVKQLEDFIAEKLIEKHIPANSKCKVKPIISVDKDDKYRPSLFVKLTNDTDMVFALAKPIPDSDPVNYELEQIVPAATPGKCEVLMILKFRWVFFKAKAKKPNKPPSYIATVNVALHQSVFYPNRMGAKTDKIAINPLVCNA